MGWSVGYDESWKRDIGYGVPATCDHPGCSNKINRGLSYVCGSEPCGGEHGCGLFFCTFHRSFTDLCLQCSSGLEPFEPSPDVAEWIDWKLTHESWQRWRDENQDEVCRLKSGLQRVEVL